MDVDTRSESFLARIVSTVSSSLELDEVLRAIVRLLSEGTGVHACFVYLLDEPEEALVLRAASDPFAHLAGRIRLERGESLAWWAAEHREPGPTNGVTSPARHRRERHDGTSSPSRVLFRQAAPRAQCGAEVNRQALP